MGACTELERSLITKRQTEGIALAEQRGAYKGRKRPRIGTGILIGPARRQRRSGGPSLPVTSGPPQLAMP